MHVDLFLFRTSVQCAIKIRSMRYKILTDFSISAIAYFFVGYYIAYGQHFFHSGTQLRYSDGYNLMRCFPADFCCSNSAIISGSCLRAKMRTQAIATLFLVALVYPFFEGIVWNGNFWAYKILPAIFGASFHDFAGSVVVHAMGGWMALIAVILLGARHGRYKKDGRVSAHPPSSIPFRTWFMGFNLSVGLAQCYECTTFRCHFRFSGDPIHLWQWSVKID